MQTYGGDGGSAGCILDTTVVRGHTLDHGAHLSPCLRQDILCKYHLNKTCKGSPVLHSPWSRFLALGRPRAVFVLNVSVMDYM
jgi:hypothetical protein